MTDSAVTLPTPAQPVSIYSELINSVSFPKKDFDMDSLMSTEVLDDSDEPVLYPSGVQANYNNDNFINVDGETDEPVLCHRSRFEVCQPLSTVSSSSSGWNDDGFENPSMVGAGLVNLVNTCFFNAVLQCFTHSVLFIQGLYSHKHPTPCDSSNEQFCLICVLREHIELSLSSNRKTVSPWKFIDNLRFFSSSFRRYQQEDAHEFLQCFLDRLESSSSNLKTKDDGLSSQTDNLVEQVFGGRAISKLRCCNCDHISETHEPFVDLSLEIEDVTSLSTALESFTKVEHIEDEEMKFTCDQCKQKVSVEKQLLLDQIPLTCAFHLKRFKNEGSRLEKIDKHVDFPLELDLQSYTCGSQSSNVDLKYEVYAVVVHSAFTSSCGHYYCYIRCAPDTWYKFDDSRVSSVSEAHVLSEEAYILFYAKQGTPWFSNFMETYKPSFYPNLPNTSPKSVLENVDPPNVGFNNFKTPIDHHNHLKSNEVAPLKPIINVIKQTSPLNLKEYGSNNRTEAQKNTCVTPTNGSKKKIYIDRVVSPLTPARSTRLDLSDYKLSEVVFAAKPTKPKLVEKVTCKRQRNNENENPAKLEAMRLCKKMPGSRGELLMAAMSAKSENTMSKSKKITSSPRNNVNKMQDRFNSANHKLAVFSFP